MLRVDELRHLDQLDAIRQEWDDLAATLSPRLPFASPDWLILWWTHFSRHNLKARDDLRVYTLRDGEGRLIAVLPMMLTSRPGFGPIHLRELQFLGADSNMTEWRGPICAAERLDAVVAALGDHFRRNGREWHWIQWRGLGPGDDETSGTPVQLSPETTQQQVDYYLRPGRDWDKFRSGLSRNLKESLRKCYNSLERDGHAFHFKVVECPEETAAAVDLFLQMHAERSNRRDTVQHLDVFAKANARAFLHDYAAGQARAGNFRAFQLFVDGVPVATRLGFVLGDEIYFYYSGYRQEWAPHSVMTTTLAEAIKWSISAGFNLINLSFGTDGSKTRWRPLKSVFTGGFELSPAWRVQAAFALIQGLRDARDPAATPERTRPIATPPTPRPAALNRMVNR